MTDLPLVAACCLTPRLAPFILCMRPWVAYSRTTKMKFFQPRHAGLRGYYHILSSMCEFFSSLFLKKFIICQHLEKISQELEKKCFTAFLWEWQLGNQHSVPVCLKEPADLKGKQGQEILTHGSRLTTFPGAGTRVWRKGWPTSDSFFLALCVRGPLCCSWWMILANKTITNLFICIACFIQVLWMRFHKITRLETK